MYPTRNRQPYRCECHEQQSTNRRGHRPSPFAGSTSVSVPKVLAASRRRAASSGIATKIDEGISVLVEDARTKCFRRRTQREPLYEDSSERYPPRVDRPLFAATEGRSHRTLVWSKRQTRAESRPSLGASRSGGLNQSPLGTTL